MKLSNLSPLERKIRQQWIDVLDIIFDQAELRGWSKKELARRSRISLSTVYRYHNKRFYWIRGDCVGKLMHAVVIDFSNLIEGGVEVGALQKGRAA